MDVHTPDDRFKMMYGLKDGWMDGKGKAPSKSGLDWFVSTYNGNFDDELLWPYVFPIPEYGGVSLMWRMERYDIDLDVDVTKRVGDLIIRDNQTHNEKHITIYDMDDEEGWHLVNTWVRWSWRHQHKYKYSKMPSTKDVLRWVRVHN